LFVDEGFVPYGVSQEKVANSLNRSDRTVRKRLNNNFRCDRGLFALQRVQLAQTTEALTLKFKALFDQFERSEIKQMDAIYKTEMSDRLFQCCGQIFKSLCNIYSNDLELLSMKRSRSIFKQFLKRDRFFEGGLEGSISR
jgi:hypothetical protein